MSSLSPMASSAGSSSCDTITGRSVINLVVCVCVVLCASRLYYIEQLLMDSLIKGKETRSAPMLTITS